MMEVPRKPAAMRERPKPPYWWRAKTKTRGVLALHLCGPRGHMIVLEDHDVAADGTVELAALDAADVECWPEGVMKLEGWQP